MNLAFGLVSGLARGKFCSWTQHVGIYTWDVREITSTSNNAGQAVEQLYIPSVRIDSHTHGLGQSSDEVFTNISLVAVTNIDASKHSVCYVQGIGHPVHRHSIDLKLYRFSSFQQGFFQSRRFPGVYNVAFFSRLIQKGKKPRKILANQANFESIRQNKT